MNQRKIATEILLKNYDSDKLLKDILIRYKKVLNKTEFGFVKNLVYKTVRQKRTLNHIISKISKIKIEKIHKPILAILQLSICQLLYMENIPKEAVVNEAVEVAKSFGNRGSVSFVNGCLRNFLRNREKFSDLSDLKGKERLSIIYSYPTWLINIIESQFKENDLEGMLKAFNEETDFTIRTNLLKTNRKCLMDSLSAKNFITEGTKISDVGIKIKNPSGIFDTKEFSEGKFYVQSESSQLASIFLDIKKNSDVLDMCASPGGKTTHLYEIAGGNINLTATDLTEEKISKINENILRLEHENIKVLKKDATIFEENFEEKFDYIMLDAPCSALGLIGNYPELKYKKNKNQVETLRKNQKKMLENASKYLKSGGSMIYSTCTFTKEENFQNISEFLENHHEFSIEKIYNKDTLVLNPKDYGTVGFSITKLKKA